MWTWVNQGTWRTCTGLSRGRTHFQPLSHALMPLSCCLQRQSSHSLCDQLIWPCSHRPSTKGCTTSHLRKAQLGGCFKLIGNVTAQPPWFLPKAKCPQSLWWFSVFLSDTSTSSKTIHSRTIYVFTLLPPMSDQGLPNHPTSAKCC